MVETVLSGFNRADLEMVLDVLHEVYEKRRNRVQYTLFGEPILRPFPILKTGGRRIRGLPISESRIRYLEPIPHRHTILAVDASLKTLFNLGSMRIVVSKVVAGAWRGYECVKLVGPYKRLGVVESRDEAGEWLLRLELEAALRAVSSAGGQVLLLDRSLSFPPYLKESTRRMAEKLERVVLARGGVLVGITKSSKLTLNTGESLVGYLISLASSRLRDMPWYYHPVFREESLPSWFLGDVVVAKFSELSDNAFRVDVSRRALSSRSVEEVIGKLAFVQDMASPGYPYPLRAVHDMSLISEHELELDRLLFLEVLREQGLEEPFMSSVHAADFKERCLWGDLS